MDLSQLIRIASLAVTAVIAVSFGLFVWDELDTASKQQLQLSTPSGVVQTTSRDAHGRLVKAEESKFRTRLDQVNDTLTSPGESIGNKVGDGNPWTMRGLALIFGLLVFLVLPRLLADWLERGAPATTARGPGRRPGYTGSSR